MPPLTLGVLAVLLRMQGSELEVYSDNRGVECLLAQVREQFHEQSSPREKLAAYERAYTKSYIRFVPYAKLNTQPANPLTRTGPATTPTGPARGSGRR
jgi:hypothetical protein